MPRASPGARGMTSDGAGPVGACALRPVRVELRKGLEGSGTGKQRNRQRGCKPWFPWRPSYKRSVRASESGCKGL